MSDTGNLQGINLQEIGLKSPITMDTNNKTEKNEFLQLFVAQLKNQNPLEPQDGSDFLGQLAQFSTVEGIKNMETAFNKIADSLTSSQAMQATNLVGKKVQVRTDTGLHLPGNQVSGSIEIPRAVNDLVLEIQNEVGHVVKTYQLNAQNKGDLAFSWDGTDENGDTLPAGAYRFVAKAHVDGTLNKFDTFIASNVDSVTINKNGQPLTLNVSGFGKVSINDIKTIS
ncbi:MAG: flagellar hook assembly protein FlgD [Candidatus Berkiella sp.]